MKTNFIFSCLCVFAAGFSQAQIVSDPGFDGATGTLETQGVAPSWVKGCANNTLSIQSGNNPIVTNFNGNNFLRLSGSFTPGFGFNMSTAAQDIGSLSAGEYVLTFDAKNQVQSSNSTGLNLTIDLKNYQGCSWITPQPSDAAIGEVLSIPMGGSLNQYSVTFCIPESMDNVLSILEFGGAAIDPTSELSDGHLDIDNVVLTPVNHQFDISYDYKIDCLTGLVKVKPTSTLNPNLYDMFILVENNPNDPNNLSDAGDITHEQIAWWGYNIDAQGWYTFSIPIDPGKNYYIKRGIWGECMDWVELRKFNLELTPDPLDANFDLEITCNELLQPILTVTGANQNGYNPHHMFILIEHFPGTNNPNQTIETISWWQQSNANNYQYQEGPFTFNTPLDPNKHYFVKRGVWNACTPWKETRRYDIEPVECNPSEICDVYITPFKTPCFDGCGFNGWLSEFQIDPNSVCYNAIDYVEFNTVNNFPFGPTHVDNTAPFTVPYCTSGSYYVTATIHFNNGATSTASYYHPACENYYVYKKGEGDINLESYEVELFPNPASDVLNIRAEFEFSEFKLYTTNGVLVGSFRGNQLAIDSLESGYYFVELYEGEALITTKRFIKK